MVSWHSLLLYQCAAYVLAREMAEKAEKAQARRAEALKTRFSEVIAESDRETTQV